MKNLLIPALFVVGGAFALGGKKKKKKSSASGAASGMPPNVIVVKTRAELESDSFDLKARKAAIAAATTSADGTSRTITIIGKHGLPDFVIEHFKRVAKANPEMVFGLVLTEGAEFISGDVMVSGTIFRLSQQNPFHLKDLSVDYKDSNAAIDSMISQLKGAK